MDSFFNIICIDKKSCCPKIVIYAEDFYMSFGNCKNYCDTCFCSEFLKWRKLFSF